MPIPLYFELLDTGHPNMEQLSPGMFSVGPDKQ